MIPRSSRPLVSALRALPDPAVTARLFADDFGRTRLRVEAAVWGRPSENRGEEVRRAIRSAVGDPAMPVSVEFREASR